MAGIYIHIPFCRQACSYCDFYFVTRQELRKPYIDRLISEIRSYRGTRFTEETIHTLYVGGGTPSLLLPPALERIMEALNDIFDMNPEEVTVEMNPDDVSESYLSDLSALGVNRASMGVQSFQPRLLEFMNRAHNREEALSSFGKLRKAGFSTFTVDLIYGNPGQTVEELDRDLEILLSFDPPHVSAYSLTIEPRTRLGKQVELGRIEPPDEERVSRHFDLVAERLAGQGLRQYEVSNFSKPGFEAVHNSSYWRHENYLGLGPAAHSFWWDERRAVRWENEKDLKAYIESGHAIKTDPEQLTDTQLAEERLMLGLRTRSGVGETELEQKYGYRFNQAQVDYLQRMAREGKTVLEDCVRLTRKGLKIADAIILDLITLQ